MTPAKLPAHARAITNNGRAAIIGSVSWPAASAEPLTISNGVFNLMRIDEDAVETRRFDYGMILTDSAGRSYRLDGHKVDKKDEE